MTVDLCIFTARKNETFVVNRVFLCSYLVTFAFIATVYLRAYFIKLIYVCN